MAETQESTLVAKIQEKLNEVRPWIQMDGGDVEFKEFKDGILTLEVLGHCVGCANFDVTFTTSIKPLMLETFKEIKDVIFVPKKVVW